jgi:hypothetical protein
MIRILADPDPQHWPDGPSIYRFLLNNLGKNFFFCVYYLEIKLYYLTMILCTVAGKRRGNGRGKIKEIGK